MSPTGVPNFRQNVEEWSQDLDCLLQNRLLGESAFITFAKDRGVPVWGVVEGDPGDFHRRGWLTSDGVDHDGGPLFHPFRVYPLQQILETCKLQIATSAPLRRDPALELVKRTIAHLPSHEEIADAARHWNTVVDFAILLEPIYWPKIVGRQSFGGGLNERNYRARLCEYGKKALELVRTLDPNVWRQQHDSLRSDAARVDGNSELYLLLRLSNWSQREKLTGHISGALWIRHLAEVIRRGFEEVHGQQWLEEDQAFERWFPGGRKRVFGSERPLDDLPGSRPYVAYDYGLNTGSAVRWYVEGETEYYATIEILPEAPKVGIELHNLHGAIASERDNAALTLEACLKEDRRQRRFSMISFDQDDPANKRAVRSQIRQGNVVGSIAAHKPDFEFANFTIAELVGVAAKIDETHGYSGDTLHNEDWTDISGGKEFEKRYRRASARKPGGLKGEEWGRALASYAIEHPRRSDNGTERRILQDTWAALHARVSNYDFQKQNFEFDPVTFKLVARPNSV